MKTSLQKLPKRKRDELRSIYDMQNRRCGTDHPYARSLFGRYARDDWVEELGQNGYYKYQSDFDLPVIVDDRNLARSGIRWNAIFAVAVP